MWAGKKQTDLDIELKGGTLVFGKVEDQNGKPRPGVRVCAWRKNGKLPSTEDMNRPLATGITREDGSYAIALQPGNYFVGLLDEPSTVRKIVIASEPQELHFSWTSGFVVRFMVANELGEAIANCKVIFEPYAQAEALSKTRRAVSNAKTITGFSATDESGVCQMTVPSGVYTFRFQPPAHGSYQSKTIRQLSIGTDIGRKIMLSLRNNQGEVQSNELAPVSTTKAETSPAFIESLPLFQLQSRKDD